MTHFIKKVFGTIKGFFFTVRCPYCGRVIEPNKSCCNKCRKEFPEMPLVRYATGGYICTSPFPYDGIFRRAVLNFKFHNCGAYADLLAKTKKNKTQHSIKAAERAKNVIGVYSPIDKNLIKGKRILIIDDIITTGSTLGECARILNKCKCGEICCCTLCTSLLI